MSEFAAILGLSGPRLTPSEKAFFRDINAWGFILFSRNVDNPDQVRRLCGDLRNAVGRDALIFVDQEGGRVQRLKAPHWRAYPTGATYAGLYNDNEETGKRAAFLGHRLIADDLRAVGISADCAPVLDLPQPGSDPIISDRALGDRTDQIIDLARAAMDGLTQGGVAPVVKHIPGHGRATVDSHLSLPRIDASRTLLEHTDFVPFRRLNDAPMAMTAHAVYTVVDDGPVTTSAAALKDLIRDTIGFDGLLMSDDLDMKALSGNSLADKTRAALDAGCDIALQCSGELPAMIDLAKGCHTLTGKAAERARVAEDAAKNAVAFDRDEAEAEFNSLLSPFV